VRITKVDAFHVDWGQSKSAWVRIWTDTGAYGLGEASPMVDGNASLEINASAVAPMLIGADPLDQRVLQDRLYHQHIKVGPEDGYAGALAAIDIALWNLQGKILHQPIDKLLGGAWRTELPFYASIGGKGVRRVDEVCHVTASISCRIRRSHPSATRLTCISSLPQARPLSLRIQWPLRRSGWYFHSPCETGGGQIHAQRGARPGIGNR